MIANSAKQFAHNLTADKNAECDRVIEINLSELVNGLFTPDLATPISKLAAEAKKNNWPDEIKVALIGSCTNSSYEDMSRSGSLVMEAKNAALELKSKYTITPGSRHH